MVLQKLPLISLYLGTLLGISASVGAVNILPLGDSITEGVNGQCSYRKPLMREMLSNPVCNAEFVGQRFNTTCGDDERPHQGKSGAKTDFYDSAEFSAVMSNPDYSPDYVLVHLGSNDIFQRESVAETINDISAVIDRIFAERPLSTVLLAKIIPWDPTELDKDNLDEFALTLELGDAIEVLANQRAAAGQAVVLVDARDGFNTTSMTIDGVHPNDIGEQLIADHFLAALESAGACAPFTVPELSLQTGEWYQLTLPADPGAYDTVADIFGDDLDSSEYMVLDANGVRVSGRWIVYGIDNEQASGYRQISIDESLDLGKFYWVKNFVGPSVMVDMPVGSLPTKLDSFFACASPRGCTLVSADIDPANADPTQPGLIWNAIGYPFNVDNGPNALGIRTSSGECAAGCSLSTAKSEGLVDDTAYHWDPAIQEYVEISPSQNNLFGAWYGLWIAVGAEAALGSGLEFVFTPVGDATD